MSFERTLFLSRLLDEHLTGSIEGYDMANELKTVTERFKAMRAARRDRIKALDERLDKHETDSDVVFRAYEGGIEKLENQIKDFEGDIEEMRNDLSDEEDEKEGEGGNTDNTVKAFPPPLNKAQTS